MPKPRRDPVVKSIRIKAPEAPARVMRAVGDDLRIDIRRRIRAGLDIYDRPAPPLNEQYRRRKVRFGMRGIRDWTYNNRPTQTLLYFLAVLRTTKNSVTIGFTQAWADRKVTWNNKRSRQWGLSRTNLAVALRSVITRTSNKIEFTSRKSA